MRSGIDWIDRPSRGRQPRRGQPDAVGLDAKARRPRPRAGGESCRPRPAHRPRVRRRASGAFHDAARRRRALNAAALICVPPRSMPTLYVIAAQVRSHARYRVNASRIDGNASSSRSTACGSSHSKLATPSSADGPVVIRRARDEDEVHDGIDDVLVVVVVRVRRQEPHAGRARAAPPPALRAAARARRSRRRPRTRRPAPAVPWPALWLA